MNSTAKILAHSFALLVFWIIGSVIGNALFSISVPTEGGGSGLLWMWVACLLNAGVIHFYLVNTSLSGIRRFVHLTGIIFGIQFFMSQMESWFFIDEGVMSRTQILAVVTGGLIMSLMYAALTLRTYKPAAGPAGLQCVAPPGLYLRVGLLAVFAYPLIYLTFGYFIAWQSPEVRTFYSGSTELASFSDMLIGNVAGSGNYFFQIFRALLWMGLAWLMLTGFSGSRKKAMLVLGGLFAVLMNAQLLLPNPFMPETVRLFHAVETASSNFLWGALIVLTLIQKEAPATTWTAAPVLRSKTTADT